MCSENHKLIHSIRNREEVSQQWSNYIVCIYKTALKLAVVTIREYHCYQLHTKFYPTFFPTDVHEIIWIVSVNFHVTDELLIRYSAFVRYWRKK
jgi:hypothetical protein